MSISRNLGTVINNIDENHNVPTVDSTGNTLIRDVLGNKNDLVSVPYEEYNSVLAFLHTGYYHVHGKSFVYPGNANDVLLTSGSGAWSESGAITEVIPVNALSLNNFDLHWITISNISAVSTIQIDIFSGNIGSEVQIGSAKASRSTNQSRNGPAPIQIPQQVVNTRIPCRLNDSTSGTVTALVSFSGHYYDEI